MSDEFKWDDDRQIVARSSGDIAIYENPHGDIVIRQKGWPDDDAVVVIPRPFVGLVIDRLAEMVKGK